MNSLHIVFIRCFDALHKLHYSVSLCHIPQLQQCMLHAFLNWIAHSQGALMHFIICTTVYLTIKVTMLSSSEQRWILQCISELYCTRGCFAASMHFIIFRTVYDARCTEFLNCIVREAALLSGIFTA